ncbi:M50 family metallopeptidase [Actinoplanes couchii]|uniref:Zn-dependent protease n=1 Tax=Actinoplanes couchii TaxID=403638 RepID=A0ABQ3XPV5_9ACTN|nr:site-2 protease family protein [Actinoplanes couchii]MDR6319101.1 membrane-associated protease RseP (regulator of RpoE activity) [Actinoplanes couchii]GID60442.1 Zn-dependent protease [Actinoplanes couchii]
MLAYVAGVVLFVVGLCLSLSIHEAGHLLTARMFGLRVRRYFVGRGPTVFSFRRGHTEYGLKALPIGGFCEIAGMTTLDELTPEENERAMWRQPWWKRTVVMAAGPVTHVFLAAAILYGMAVSTGLPNLNPVTEPVVASTSCVGATCPAADAGLLAGDRITAVGGAATPLWTDVLAAVRAAGGPTAVTVQRGGRTLTLTVDVARVTREGAQVGMIGATAATPPAYLRHGPVAAVGATVVFTGDLLQRSAAQLVAFPQRIPAVIAAIGGAERTADTPVSMVGASRLGGEAAERGLWEVFLLLMASLNLFMAVFNLLPLLPLDGGHIMIVWYERLRDTVRRLRGRPALGPVDFTRLYPVTMALVLIGGAVMLLTITADVVNPLRLS